MHVDMDYFYAACEEKLNPGLKGKPLVICVYSARGGGRGAVSTANYEARRLGVHSGISCLEAKRLVPGAVFLPANFEVYGSISKRIMRYLRTQGDTFERIGVDEAFLDVTRRVGGSYENAVKLAKKIKEDIYKTEKLTCSIGVAPSRLVAKIASGNKKPDGLTVVEPSGVRDFLTPLKVTELWGVGKKTAEVLKDMSISTVGGLAEADPRVLIEKFGRTRGSWLYNAARGLDLSKVQEKTGAKQISRITTLPINTRDRADIASVLKKLSKEVHRTLRKRGFSCRTVSFIAVTQDRRFHSKSKTMQSPITDEGTIRSTAEKLMEEFLGGTTLALRRVGVRVSELNKVRRQRTLLDY
jgi:DNA polymerase IV (DinB-like DNA polymerase)